MNQAEIPQGQGSGFIWDTKVHLDLSVTGLPELHWAISPGHMGTSL